VSLPYAVFSVMPDFEKEPEYGTVNLVERINVSPAPDTALFPQTTPDLTFNFEFAMEVQDLRTVKKFFLDRGGRNEPFYLPSWRADLPAVSGASGASLITVLSPGYPAAHFGGSTRADGRGRQIFIWQPGEDLFTTAVVGAEELLHGNVELSLSGWLPFTVNAKTAIIGFLHLARFEEDQLDYEHLLSTEATATIRFRGIRAWNGEESVLTVEPVTVETDWLGFESATIEAEDAPPADERVSYSLGPAVYETPEFPQTAEWAAWVNPDGIRFTDTLDIGGQVTPDGSGSLTALATGFVNTEHLSLCFLNNAQEAIAYQLTATGIRVSAHTVGSPVHFNFTGLDPVIVWLGNLSPGLGEDADFICYYRLAGENILYCRLSRDGFATEHVAARLPVKLLKLKGARISEGRILLDCLDTGFRHVTLTSPEYE
jgi:hypothetical protein